MFYRLFVYFSVLLFAPFTFCFADSIRIAQIDSNALLLKQQIKLYLSVTDNNGVPIEHLEAKNFLVSESPDGQKFIPRNAISKFQVGSNYEKGTNFLLLIDNSGSMYRTMEGTNTEEPSEMRITAATKAVRSLLKSMLNPADRVGLVVYNSYYKSFSKPIKDKVQIEQYLDQIKKPKGDEAFTEIYGSLYLAVDEFRTVKGRKALIILSDGENSPYYTNTKRAHKRFDKKIFSYQEPLESLQIEGISLYTIYFGKEGEQKEKHLTTIATESGGSSFDAHNTQELEQVYFRIMDQILKEYVVTYHASMEPTDKKYVNVDYRIDGNVVTTAKRFYFSSTVLGKPQNEYWPLYLFLFFLACFSLGGITRIRFEKSRPNPNIEVLKPGLGQISTMVLDLTAQKTVIGGAFDADITIAGVPTIKENHATVLFDTTTNQYTLVGHGNLKVNNKQVTTKILASGDVINIDGTIMVFDKGGKTKES